MQAIKNDLIKFTKRILYALVLKEQIERFLIRNILLEMVFIEQQRL